MSATTATTPATAVNTTPSRSLILPTSPLQPDALLSVQNVATTSSAAFRSTDLLDALSDRNIPQFTSTSTNLLPDVGLLHLSTSSHSSSATVLAASNNQQAPLSLSSTSSQPSTANYSAFSANALTDVDYQSMYSSSNVCCVLVYMCSYSPKM